MPAPFALARPLVRPLARDASADPQDILETKSTFQKLRLYDPPFGAVDEVPDAGLFQSIARFQKDEGLTVDGRMAPGGETEARLKNRLKQKSAAKALPHRQQLFRPMGLLGVKAPRARIPKSRALGTADSAKDLLFFTQTRPRRDPVLAGRQSQDTLLGGDGGDSLTGAAPDGSAPEIDQAALSEAEAQLADAQAKLEVIANDLAEGTFRGQPITSNQRQLLEEAHRRAEADLANARDQLIRVQAGQENRFADLLGEGAALLAGGPGNLIARAGGRLFLRELLKRRRQDGQGQPSDPPRRLEDDAIDALLLGETAREIAEPGEEPQHSTEQSRETEIPYEDLLTSERQGLLDIPELLEEPEIPGPRVDLTQPPSDLVRTEVDRIKSQMTGLQMKDQTFAVAILEDSQGHRRMVIASSGDIDKTRNWIEQANGAFYISGLPTIHAEADIVRYAEDGGYRILDIGATNGICHECEAIIPNDTHISTPLRSQLK